MMPSSDVHAQDRTWVCARRISGRRRDRGLTQAQVVERLSAVGLRMTNRTLSRLENGQGIDVSTLPLLSDVLDCTVTYLLGLTDDPERWEPDRAAPVTGDAPPAGVADVPDHVPEERSTWILGPGPFGPGEPQETPADHEPQETPADQRRTG